MGVGECLAKCVIVCINIVFMIIGLVFMGAGGVLLGGRSLLEQVLTPIIDSINDVNSATNLNSTVVQDTASSVDSILAVFEPLAIALLVLGIFLLIITILAMCGSCCSLKIVLIVYVVIVLVIFLAHLIVFLCLMFGVFGPDIKGALVTALEKEYVGISGTNAASLLWNYIMIRYKCCGVTDYNDFDKAEQWANVQTFTYDTYSETVTLITPIACCLMDGDFPSVTPVDDKCSYEPTDAINNWKTSCWDQINIELVQPNETIVIATNAAILALEALLAALTIFVLVMHDKSKIMPV